MNNSIRQQQWKRVHKLRKIGWISALSLTSGSLLYYYINQNTLKRDPLFKSNKLIINNNKTKKILITDPLYTDQFIPHSILASNNEKKSKFFGLLQQVPLPILPQNNIKDILTLTNGDNTKIGYYIDSRGDLYKWDEKNKTTDKILSNYNLTSIKYSNNQIYSLSQDGNIYIFPTNDPNLLKSFYSKSRLPFISDYYNHKIEKIDNNKIIQFDTGKNHLLYINNKGKAFAVPTNSQIEKFEQFGIIMGDDESSPQLSINKSIDLILLNNELSLIENKMIPRKIIKIACGENHSIGLTANGDILTFGNNKFGQLGHPILNFNHLNIPFPKQISPQRFKPYGINEKPIDIFAMANTSFILLSNNILLSLGDGQLGQLGNNTYKTFQCDPTRVKFDGKIKSLQTNSLSNHGLIIDDENSIWSFGNNTQGQLMLGNHYSQSKPVKLNTLPSNLDKDKLIVSTTTTTSTLTINT
ncbi:hypothetical protein MOUN0_G07734 [Monosporozyma unispora]|nr:hypothetical protein C6P44_005287 [Kazachstania unispora]